MTNLIYNSSINFDEYKDHLKRQVSHFFRYVELTHECIFSEIDKSTVAMTYLSEAHSIIRNLDMLSIFVDDLTRNEMQELIQRFYQYNNEVLNCYRTDHSHQHSDIYFQQLLIVCRDVATTLDIYSSLTED